MAALLRYGPNTLARRHHANMRCLCCGIVQQVRQLQMHRLPRGQGFEFGGSGHRGDLCRVQRGQVFRGEQVGMRGLWKRKVPAGKGEGCMPGLRRREVPGRQRQPGHRGLRVVPGKLREQSRGQPGGKRLQVQPRLGGAGRGPTMHAVCARQLSDGYRESGVAGKSLPTARRARASRKKAATAKATARIARQGSSRARVPPNAERVMRTPRGWGMHSRRTASVISGSTVLALTFSAPVRCANRGRTRRRWVTRSSFAWSVPCCL